MPIIGGRGAGVRGLGFQGAGRPAMIAPVTVTNVGSGRAFNNGRIDVSWSAPANNGAPITGYRIERSTNGTTFSTLVANHGSTSYSDTGLTSAQQYWYRVAAINSVGIGPNSDEFSAIATTVPQAPTIGTATVSGTTASVPFTANSNGGSTVTTFTATSSPGSITGTNSASPISVSGLSGGTSYTFTVTATNANGTSVASSASNSVTTELVLQNLAMSIMPGGSFSGGTFAAAGAAFGSDGSLYCAGYYRDLALNATRVYLAKNAGISGTVLPGTGEFIKHYNVAGNNTGVEEKSVEQVDFHLDTNNNSYIAFDNNGNNVLSVYKINSSGDPVWGKFFGIQGYNYGSIKVRAANSGNVYVMYDHGYGPVAVIKYNSSGVLQWVRGYDGSPGGEGEGETAPYPPLLEMTVDSSENVYVGGVTRSLWGQYEHGYVAKLNSSGTVLWQRQITGLGQGDATFIKGLAIASDQNLIVSLATNDNTGVLKLSSSNGNLIWQRYIRGVDGSGGVSILSNSNIAVLYSNTDGSSVGDLRYSILTDSGSLVSSRSYNMSSWVSNTSSGPYERSGMNRLSTRGTSLVFSGQDRNTNLLHFALKATDTPSQISINTNAGYSRVFNSDSYSPSSGTTYFSAAYQLDHAHTMSSFSAPWQDYLWAYTSDATATPTAATPGNINASFTEVA